MYGMVNKSVQALVTTKFGIDKWEEIKQKAGVTIEAFISNESYPDAMTYGLIGAATEVLKLSADEILFSFGEFWVLNTARQDYGDLLSSAGRNMPEFLDYLPMFHTRVALIFPHLKPPRFECSDRQADRITMHYFSHRPGLSVFVRGLFSGIAKMYDTPAQITQTKFKDKGDDHDEFLVCWGDAIQKSG
jgi:hypothetical protein